MNRLDATEGGITATQLADFVALEWRLTQQTARATNQIRIQIAATQSAKREAIGLIHGTIQVLDQVSAAIAAALEEQSVVTREMPKTMQTASLSVSGIARSVDAIARAGRNVNRATR